MSKEEDPKPDNAGSPVVKDIDLYKDWDPLKAERNSYLNTFSYDQDDPVAIITGTKALTTQNIPCRFYKFDSPGSTCRRFGCRFLHDRTVAAGIATKDEKLATPRILEQITLLSELPPKTPAPDGIINCGVVVSISDPGDFYIVPHGDWTCVCKHGKDSEEYTAATNSGIKNLLNLWEDLGNFFVRITKQDSSYSRNQLVAVRIKTKVDREKQWFRAVVLEDVVLGITDDLPVVKLRLLDFGPIHSTTIDNVVPLPRKLLRYPQLGYRCALNGINPITHRWSRRAIEAFRHLAHGQECIFEITRTVMPEAEGGDGIFEVVPHLVELIVKLNGKYVNVTTELGNEGLGVLWNPFPTRPSIFKDVSNPRALALLMAKEPTHSISIDAQIPPHIFEREDGRLEKYLNRCHFTDPQLTADYAKNSWGYRPGTIVNEPGSQMSSADANPGQSELSIIRRYDTLEETPNDRRKDKKVVSSNIFSDPCIKKVQGSELPRKSQPCSVAKSGFYEDYSGPKPVTCDTDKNWRSDSFPPKTVSEVKDNSHSSNPVTRTSKKKQKWKKLEI